LKEEKEEEKDIRPRIWEDFYFAVNCLIAKR